MLDHSAKENSDTKTKFQPQKLVSWKTNDPQMAHHIQPTLTKANANPLTYLGKTHVIKL